MTDIADIFLKELAKDEYVSPSVKKLGELLAQKHKDALQTLADLAKGQCEMFYRLEALEKQKDISDKFSDSR